MKATTFVGLTRPQSYYVWNPTGGAPYYSGKYILYDYDGTNYVTVPFTGVQNNIESGQGFIIQNNSGTTATFTIEEGDKGNGSANVSRQGVNVPTLEINLISKDASGVDIVTDGAKINFDNNFSNTIDNLDVRKVANTFDNLSIKTAGQTLFVERRKNLQDADTIQLNISGMRTASFTLEIDPSVLANAGVEATLKDRCL